MTQPTIADVLRRGRRSALAGRDIELRLLRQIAMPGGPLVAYVHGPAGIGKTALLSALAADFENDGVRHVRIQAGAVEPRPASVVSSLAKAFGVDASTVADLATALSVDKGIVVVMVDDVDTWRLVSSWLRTELLPALPANMRFVLAGAAPPPAVWSTEYGQHFLEIRLGTLARSHSDASVAAANLSPGVADRIWLLTGGHPLGLQMAIHACRTGSLDTVRDAGELANTILHAIGDSELRRAVEACAIVRRANRELVSLILGVSELVPLSLLEAVEALPFATRDPEGLYITEPVRQAIVEWMSGVDAERYQAWRKLAADWIAVRARSTRGVRRWRHLADLLYLLEEPSLRNAFFPSDAAAPAVELARPGDFAQIFQIAEIRSGADERTRLQAWAERMPHRFSVARGSNDEVLAFYLFARQDDAHAGLESVDPVFAECQRHLATNPVNGEVLFIRNILAKTTEAHAAARAACVLDLKRNYIERSSLARIYCNFSEEDSHVLQRLGFRPLKQSRMDLPATMVLEVPGGDIVEWVCALVDTGSSTASRDDDFAFARDRREILIDEQVVELTPLEAKVLSELMDRAPAVVRREDLIERVWRRSVVGSNVVDTVIRTLRRKMASKRDCVQTVAKAGYRYVGRDRSLGR
ncbi:MAG: winged helix-turn-helix domain-containing protein [Povalibacter sp.]